jgi:hypothetical protein
MQLLQVMGNLISTMQGAEVNMIQYAGGVEPDEESKEPRTWYTSQGEFDPSKETIEAFLRKAARTTANKVVANSLSALLKVFVRPRAVGVEGGAHQNVYTFFVDTPWSRF